MSYIQERELQSRFSLSNGQMRSPYRFKNVRWYLNGEYFGCGDLIDSDIERIAMCLDNGELFEGFNEHHGGAFQQTTFPYIRIVGGRSTISFPLQENYDQRRNAQSF